MHTKTSAHPSWDFRAKDGWNVGVSLEHYWCLLIDVKDTKSDKVSDTVEFLHHYLTKPTLTNDDRVLHEINTLSCDLKDAPTISCNALLRAITELRELFKQWADPSQFATVPVQPKNNYRSRKTTQILHTPDTK